MEGRKFFALQLFLILFIGAILFSGFNHAYAVGESYGVTPMIIDVKAQARDIIKKTITLTNDGQRGVQIYPFVNNMLVDERGIQEFQDIGDADKSISLANWIQFPRGVIELKPGESQTIVFSIQVNLEAKPGVYHARIAFPYGGPTRADAETRVNESPFVMVNLEITEKVSELLELKKFLAGKTFFLGLPASLLYSIENIGNKELVPRGDIIIYDRTGKEVTNVSINSEGKSVSPGNIIDLTSELKEGSFFGKYKAFLNIRYGDNQKGSINDTIFFYVFPWQKMMIVFAIATMLAWLSAVWIHNKKSRSLSHYADALTHTSVFHSTGHNDYYERLAKEVRHRREVKHMSGSDGHPAGMRHSASGHSNGHKHHQGRQTHQIQEHHQISLKGVEPFKKHKAHITDLRKK